MDWKSAKVVLTGFGELSSQRIRFASVHQCASSSLVFWLAADSLLMLYDLSEASLSQ